MTQWIETTAGDQRFLLNVADIETLTVTTAPDDHYSTIEAHMISGKKWDIARAFISQFDLSRGSCMTTFGAMERVMAQIVRYLNDRETEILTEGDIDMLVQEVYDDAHDRHWADGHDY